MMNSRTSRTKHSVVQRRWFCSLALLLLGLTPLASIRLFAQEDRPEVTEPYLVSIYPPGGKPNERIRAEIRGVLVAGAYGVWFEDAGVNGRVRTVEETNDVYPEKKRLADRKTKSLPVYRIT